MKESYLGMIGLIERLHRQFLELVRTELDDLGVQDINNIQALILFNVGTNDLTVGELTLRGCYLGSNVSYNVKKMVETDYLIQERSTHDRRSVRVRLSPKGLELCAKLDAMHNRHVGDLVGTPIDKKAADDVTLTLKRLDRFWTQIIDKGVRYMPGFSGSAA